MVGALFCICLQLDAAGQSGGSMNAKLMDDDFLSTLHFHPPLCCVHQGSFSWAFSLRYLSKDIYP